ncbi:MAG: VPLPA-CTERM-specific exosortase XrtD [Sedimenticola sp.]
MELRTTSFGWNVSPFLWGLVTISVSLLAYAYWDGVTDMLYRWNSKEEYGYAYFLPLISAWLIWQRRNDLAQIEFRPSWIGIGVVLIAGLFFFLGGVATTFTLVQYSLVLCLLGLAYALMGWNAFKLVAGPLFLLFFIVPFPTFFYNTLSGQLQLVSSEIGVAVIRLFGISVYLEGNVIDLGSYKLQVVEACSGLRYLFPLVSIAYLAAYLYTVEMWKRVVVFLSSIPITVLMNSFRIGVIGWLVDRWGIEQADGFLHDFEGWVIFMACTAILLLEMLLLARIGSVKRKLNEVFGLEAPEPLPVGLEMKPRPVVPVHFGILGSVVLIALGSLYVKGQVEVHPERDLFSHFPQQMGGWRGRDEKLESIYLDSLKLDDYLLSDYSNDKGKLVNFYVAYYASQQAGSAAHSPRTCIPGGGWQIESITQVEIPGNWPLQANRLVIKRGDYKQLVYYWFQQRGRVIASEWMVKWYLFWDALTKHRTDGALVRVTTAIGPTEDWSDGDRRLGKFAQEAIPLLEGFVPE